MGGDKAPMATVQGALLAIQQDRETRVLLVGDEERIRSEIDAHREGRGLASSLEIVPAADTVGMGEPPVEALRRKKDTSIVKAVQLVERKEAEAIVSAGNTGATVAASTLSLKLLNGVRRPGIAVTLPSVGGPVTIIDVGANIKCKPRHLLQYGVMASAYYEHTHQQPDPKVGLLNVGAEALKGNELVRQTEMLFRKSSLRFVGNVEGQEIFQGNCQVFVCDGFTGNLILKVSEGVAVGFLELMKRRFKGEGVGTSRRRPGLVTAVKKWFFGRLLGHMRGVADYAEYGGAPLLGVDGVCIISHGRSDAKAIANGIRAAREFKAHRVNSHIEEQIAPLLEARPTSSEVG